MTATLATSTTDALYGVFRAGHVRVALPLDELREVIMRPPEFSQLPATATGLLGAVNLRHVVIPVLDLGRLAGFDEHPDGGRVIVIVALNDPESRGQVFGLLADEIEGVAKVCEDARLETTVAGDRPALFRYTFERPEDRAVVALLDASAIAALPGIPVVRDVGVRPPAGNAGQADSSRRTVLLLRCGVVGLSIEVTHVHSVIPQLVLHSSPLEGPSCRGVVHLQGRAVPAVDPLQMLGLGTVSDDGNLRGLVLSTDRGLVVLAVSDIADITAVPVDDVLPMPPLGLRKGGFVTGILRTASGDQHVLLDGAALRADPELTTLGGLGLSLEGYAEEAPATNTPPAETPEGRRVITSVRKFLTYSVGMEAATPLDQISEILPYPEHAIALDSGSALLGIFTHRKLSVPLLSLPTLLGLPGEVDATTARVLLVDAPDGNLVGFVVPSLHAIEDSVWEESGPAEGTDPTQMLQRGPLVKIGTEDQGRLLPHVDLLALVDAELA